MTPQDAPSVEWLTEVLHLSIKAGDARGVDAALRLIAVQDPALAQTLLDTLQLALLIADGGSP